MSKRPYRVFMVSLIIFCFLLAACQKATPVTPTAIPTITNTQTLTQTATPTPSQTPTLTASPSPTQEATPTTSPTPPVVNLRDDLSLSNTLLPPINEIITVDNTNQVRAIAAWGTGEANTINLSPDGRFLAVGTNIGAYLYETTNFLLMSILQTPFTVQSIAFSSDNQLIALGQYNNTVDIYHFDDFSFISRLSISGLGLQDLYEISVNFSPDDTVFFTVIKIPGEIIIRQWDTNSWQPKGGFSLDAGLDYYINDSIDLIGIITKESLILHPMYFLEETSTRQLPSTELALFWEKIPLHNSLISPSLDGNFLLISNGLSIIHWKVLEETTTYHLDDYPKDIIDSCYQAPDSCLNKAKGFSWKCENALQISPITLIALNPDNTRLLVSLTENRTEFRRSSNGVLIWDIETRFLEVSFSPNGDFLYGLLPDGSIEKRATLDGDLIDVLNQHPSRLYDLAFSPDGVVLAAGYHDGWIRIYSTVNGQMLGVLDGNAHSLQFSPDGGLLAAGLHDGTVRIFELAEARHYDLGNGHQAAVTDLAFTIDGEQLLTGSNDCTASLWGLVNRYRIQNLTPDSDDPFRVTSVAYSPINTIQYFSGNRHGIYVVEGTETQEVFFAEDHSFAELTLSPDWDILAATGQKTWLLHNIASEFPTDKRQLLSEMGSEGQALTFSPSGSMLIIATMHGLEFWSVEDAEFLTYLPYVDPTPAGNRPVALIVSPSGLLVALGSRDGLITIYGIPEVTDD